MTAALDHIVIASPDLTALVEWFAERTRVTAQPGGRHPTGTQNALVALTIDGRRGPQYIELIGPYTDAAAGALPEKFGISELSGPAVQAFAVHPSDIAVAVERARTVGWPTGPVEGLSRHTPEGELLEWRLTKGEPGVPDRYDVPFLIDWGATPQPGETTVPSLELLDFARLESSVERVDALRGEYAEVGVSGIDVRLAERAGFALTVRTAAGDVVEFLPA